MNGGMIMSERKSSVQGQSRSGGSGGRMNGKRPGAGPGGNCECPSCGTTVPHQAGVPCNTINCPKCGAQLTRQQN